MRLRAICILLFMIVPICFGLTGCNLEQFPVIRQSNPAPTAASGKLAINESGTIQIFDTVSAIYYPNWRAQASDSVAQPVLIIIADSAQDTVRISLANVKPDTATYYVTDNIHLGSTSAYFAAPSYSQVGLTVSSYFLVPYGQIVLTEFDTIHKELSGSFTFDQNVGRPQERLYLDGTFNKILYKVVQ